jgi:FkbM family methyltransferase
MITYSEHGEENILNNYFQGKKNGIVLEAGARDGLIDSNSRWLIENFGWTGVLVEADSRQFSKLQENYTNHPVDKKHLVRAALYSKPGLELDLNLADAGGLHSQAGHTTVSEDFKKRAERLSSVQYYGTEKVKTVTVTSLLNELGIDYIDYVSIDCEGADLFALQGIDFNTTTIDLISFEPSINVEEMISLLEHNGFVYYTKTGGNVFFRNSKLKKDLT